MSIQKSPSRRSLFEPDQRDIQAMQSALIEIVSLRQKALLAEFMLEENVLHYSHGIRWRNPANSFSENGEMESMTAEYTIPFQRIVDGDLTLMTESINSIAEQMSDGFTKKMYQVMNEACDRSGNVVTGKDFPESFLEVLEKIEFSVDKNGSVQLPQLHVGSSLLVDQLRAQPQEFHEKVEKIKEKKGAEAIQRERERLSRYKAKTL